MSKKTIQLNQEFLKTPSAFLGTNSGNKTLKNRTHERKEKPQIIIKPNNIKKQLLQKIKNYQNKDEEQGGNEPKLPIVNEKESANPIKNETVVNDNENNNTNTNENSEFESEFNKSLNFLQNLSSQKNNNTNNANNTNNNTNNNGNKKNKNKNKTLKNYKTPQVATELPPELCIDTTPMMRDIVINNIPNAESPVLQLKEQPSYSNLKNGSKPTYRQIHNKTQKKTSVNEYMPSDSISKQSEDNAPRISFNIDANEDNKFALADIVAPAPSTIQTPAPSTIQTPAHSTIQPPALEEPTMIRKKITRTSKYKLGKKGNKVAVLIRNNKTRKLIQHEQAILKSKSILDVKNYLRKKNLLKIGSDAPPDILRQIYENSILAGDIENKSKETLIHNYMHDK
jgi:hypothetical protein